MTLAQALSSYVIDGITIALTVIIGFVGHAVRSFYLAHTNATQRQQVAQDVATLQAAVPLLEKLVPAGSVAGLANGLAALADHLGLSISGQTIQKIAQQAFQQGEQVVEQTSESAAPAAPVAPQEAAPATQAPAASQ